jgi:hypothetical protein
MNSNQQRTNCERVVTRMCAESRDGPRLREPRGRPRGRPRLGQLRLDENDGDEGAENEEPHPKVDVSEAVNVSGGAIKLASAGADVDNNDGEDECVVNCNGGRRKANRFNRSAIEWRDEGSGDAGSGWIVVGADEVGRGWRTGDDVGERDRVFVLSVE